MHPMASTPVDLAARGEVGGLLLNPERRIGRPRCAAGGWVPTVMRVSGDPPNSQKFAAMSATMLSIARPMGKPRFLGGGLLWRVE